MLDTISLVIIASIIALIGASAYFSASEMAFASLSKIRLKNMVKEGDQRAKRTLEMSENFDEILTTVLVGNNLVNTLAASLSTALFISLMANSADWISSLTSTLVMVFLILVFAEITPKSIAKANSENIAMALTPSLSKVVWVFKPISKMFIGLKSAIARRFKKTIGPTMTEEELIVMVEEIEGEGAIEKHESELIRSAIEFDNITVEEILTPRVDIHGVDITSNKYEIKYAFTSTGFSRIIVFDGTIDKIVGVIYVKDFYNHYLDSESMTIQDILRPVKFVPETTKISSLLSELQRSKTHIAVVLDSYGGTVGIVTLEDMIEELVGEIWDESDEVEYAVVKESDDSYSVLGGANIYDVMDEIGVRFDPGEFEDHTVGGFVQYKLDRIPAKGDKVVLDNAIITVRSTKNRRIRQVTIEKVSQGQQE